MHQEFTLPRTLELGAARRSLRSQLGGFSPVLGDPGRDNIYGWGRINLERALDNLPTRAGTTDGVVYTSFLFGPGAFAKGAAPLDGTPLQGGHGTEGVELARVPLVSDTVLINRRRFILHPRGVKFTSASVAGDSPANAELETAANWVRIWENKNVRLVAITHNN